MTDAPSVFALLLVTGAAAGTAIAVAQLQSVRQGALLVLAVLMLLAVSLGIGTVQNSSSDLLRVLTLRPAVEPCFVQGYVWGEYGLLVGGLLGTLVVYGRRWIGKHDA